MPSDATPILGSAASFAAREHPLRSVPAAINAALRSLSQSLIQAVRGAAVPPTLALLLLGSAVFIPFPFPLTPSISSAVTRLELACVTNAFVRILDTTQALGRS